MVQKCLDCFDGIDILLVNSADIIMIAPVVNMEEKDWDIALKVNVKGIFCVLEL